MNSEYEFDKQSNMPFNEAIVSVATGVRQKLERSIRAS